MLFEPQLLSWGKRNKKRDNRALALIVLLLRAKARTSQVSEIPSLKAGVKVIYIVTSPTKNTLPQTNIISSLSA